MVQDLLIDYPVITKIPVQWGDMDAANHVNNVIYLRWFESGRIDYFKQLNLTDFSGKQSQVGPILGAIDCKYIFPVTYPDTVYIGSRVREPQPDRFILETAIVSQRHERLVTLGKAVIVGYDYQKLMKANFPQEVFDKIKELEYGISEFE